MKAPLPPNEAARLEALRQYHLLDTAPEQSLDDVTHLAAYICGTPTALISLVDETRQWFKSRFGLNMTEPPPGTGVLRPHHPAAGSVGSGGRAGGPAVCGQSARASGS
jgi:hypothetical protein